MPTKTTEVSKTNIKLYPHQDELQQLGELAGIHMDFRIFRILIEFLNMGADPLTIFNGLKAIRHSFARQSRKSSRASISSIAP